MNSSYGILCGAIPERILEGTVEKDIWIWITPALSEYQVDGNGSTTTRPFPPNLQSVTPEAPKLRSARGDLKPMAANEKEVV
jgi:hypothetical protein